MNDEKLVKMYVASQSLFLSGCLLMLLPFLLLLLGLFCLIVWAAATA